MKPVGLPCRVSESPETYVFASMRSFARGVVASFFSEYSRRGSRYPAWAHTVATAAVKRRRPTGHSFAASSITRAQRR
jgi:hypothetical protein